MYLWGTALVVWHPSACLQAVFMILLPEVQTADPDTVVTLSQGAVASLSKHNALVHAALANLNQNTSRFNAGEQLERQVRPLCTTVTRTMSHSAIAVMAV